MKLSNFRDLKVFERENTLVATVDVISGWLLLRCTPRKVFNQHLCSWHWGDTGELLSYEHDCLLDLWTTEAMEAKACQSQP